MLQKKGLSIQKILNPMTFSSEKMVHVPVKLPKSSHIIVLVLFEKQAVI